MGLQQQAAHNGMKYRQSLSASGSEGHAYMALINECLVEVVIRTFTVRVHNFYCNVSMTLWSPSSGKKTTKNDTSLYL